MIAFSIEKASLGRKFNTHFLMSMGDPIVSFNEKDALTVIPFF